MAKIIRPLYETKTYNITARDVEGNTFVPLANRREINDKVVRDIYRQLEAGEHFESPIVVSYKRGQNRLLDGNHRYEAIAAYLAEHPEDSIQVTMHVYQGLTDADEKKKYTRWNKGRKQSTKDYIKQFEVEIPAFSQMQASFPWPIDIYGREGVPFFKLVSCYLAAKETSFSGGFIGGPDVFIKEAQALTDEDIETMAQFAQIMVGAFGGNIKDNITKKWLRSTPITALCRLYLDNKSKIPGPKMSQIFRLKLEHDANALAMGGSSGMSACKYVWQEYAKILNEGARPAEKFDLVIPPKPQRDTEEDEE